jgi:sugar-specific transcriptional regulator TrmB
MADAGNVTLRVSPEDPYVSIQSLFNRCKEDVRTSIASSIADIREYVRSLSPNSKTKVVSPQKLDAALESMKQTAHGVCLTSTEKEEFEKLMHDIKERIDTEYLENGSNKLIDF